MGIIEYRGRCSNTFAKVKKVPLFFSSNFRKFPNQLLSVQSIVYGYMGIYSHNIFKPFVILFFSGLRVYKGKVSFLPVAEYHSPNNEKDQKVLSKVRRFSLRSHSSVGDNSPILQRYQRYSVDSFDSFQQQTEFGSGDDLRKLRANTTPATTATTATSRYNHSPTGLIVRSDAQPGSNGGEATTKTTNSHSHLSESDSEDKSFHSTTSRMSSESALIGIGENTGNGDVVENDKENNSSSTTESNDQIFDDSNTDVSNCNTPAKNNSQCNGHMEANSTETKEEESTKYVGRSRAFTVLGDEQEVDVTEETVIGRKADFSPVPTPLLPLGLDEPVPENWVTIEGEFVVVCAAYQTHLGSDVIVAPSAHLTDGCIHLMLVREGVSRNALLNLVKSIATGSHIHSPHVEVVKVLAFRLEPITKHGNIMIDGERFDPQPIQAQILPGLARTMAIQ